MRDAAGRRLIDFRRSNLHVVNYSEPVRRKLPLAELKQHLFALPDRPDWIPYRTSYYDRSWGFCLSQRELDALPEGEYEAVIESRLEPGALTYGELLLPGETDEEVLISTHCCHPSLANDNLSGIALSTWLARTLAGAKRRYGYRFLFLPGHDRVDHLALAERGGDVPDPRRPRRRMRRRRRPASLQEEPPRKRGDRPRGRPRAPALRRRASRARVLSLRLRRAPVLLARLRPPGGKPDAHAPWPLSRVPHLGGRSRLRAARVARRIVSDLPGGARRARGERALRSTPTRRANRSSESGASIARSGGCRTPASTPSRCSGC